MSLLQSDTAKRLSLFRREQHLGFFLCLLPPASLSCFIFSSAARAEERLNARTGQDSAPTSRSPLLSPSVIKPFPAQRSAKTRICMRSNKSSIHAPDLSTRLMICPPDVNSLMTAGRVLYRPKVPEQKSMVWGKGSGEGT